MKGGSLTVVVYQTGVEAVTNLEVALEIEVEIGSYKEEGEGEGGRGACWNWKK